jgi:predicted Rossmann fold nucleotide-binding protein DprA/Smf involved in DNA uptake
VKIGIVGSRRRHDRELVEALVNELPEGTVIISGGCKGIDTWAAETARARKLTVIEYFPALPPSGSPHWAFTKAYHERNRRIAESSDVVYAFVAPDRKGGTENTINYAKTLGVHVEVING